ncbi:triose-phosphate isomerase [Rhodoplanes sp. Z2-YC6860]|uniref:triose-phosphate isomerase n=1 Tax=Rhodoplanes sp. Z2-YC6860 TaxID=674703 RepID=UPI00078DED22|nr:triose-phosphate isomerase [Rhodoplanes sp. Z2-YC6860]AMN42364.1 triosephosphate isomerase [Rhodoplanes sp. Z2-YC6860]
MAASQRRPLVAGNWKMNGLQDSIIELEKIAQGADTVPKADLMICPPATLIGFCVDAVESVEGSRVAIGGQDCHAKPSGAFTGDIAAEMLADIGAVAVIVGHSERRTYHKETDADVRAKAEAAWRANLCAIVCIGETQAEREAGKTLDVLGRQLDGSLPDGATGSNLVIAYEPVWAIGTGLTPTAADVAEAHAFIRKRLASRYGSTADAIRILYGGSVKPSNAAELMGVANVDGALVGGASLKADDFFGIAAAYR